jgi:hypothetical protein
MKCPNTFLIVEIDLDLDPKHFDPRVLKRLLLLASRNALSVNFFSKIRERRAGYGIEKTRLKWFGMSNHFDPKVVQKSV